MLRSIQAIAAMLLLVLMAGCPPDTVSVPDVVGETQASAEINITAVGLTVGTVTQEASESVPAGNVIRQNPVANTSVAPGSAVDLVISTGPARVSVPNVANVPQAQAEAALAAAGLSVGTITEESSETIAAGNVIRQNPAANDSVAPGTAVNLVISTGPVFVDVPNVVGQSQAVATTAITGAGLVVGTVTQQSSDSVAAGLVIEQSPAAFESVRLNTAVDLVVSTGPACAAEVPDVRNGTEQAAATAVAAVGMTLGTVTYDASASVAVDLVISQDPESGACAEEGGLVNLVVSLGNVIPIRTVADLQRIGNDPAFPLNGNYALAGDLDGAVEGKGIFEFTPIGSEAAPFTGNFDGRGHLIYGLHITQPDATNVGLFGYVGEFDSLNVAPQIKNLALEITVGGKNNVGGLVGFGASGTISDCFVHTEVSGESNVGGVVGYCAMFINKINYSSGNTREISYTGSAVEALAGFGGIAGAVAPQSILTDCFASARITAPGAVGGIAGINEGGIVGGHSISALLSEGRQVGGISGLNTGFLSRCTSSGRTDAGYEVGGIAGRSQNAQGISECRAFSDVHATRFGGAGGLVGVNLNSPVIRSFATNNVQNESPWSGSGGLIGILGEGSVVSDCYATANVEGADDVGGLVGQASFGSTPVTIERCFATGHVDAPGDAGGLIGWFDTNMTPTVTECFWDAYRTAIDTSFGGLGTGLDQFGLSLEETFAETAWDFETVWFLDLDNPVLRWSQP